MKPEDQIVQDLYETLDHMKPTDRRYRAVDHVVSARRATRAKDVQAALFFYNEAIRELKTSSNDEAHRAVRVLQEHSHFLRNGA